MRWPKQQRRACDTVGSVNSVTPFYATDEIRSKQPDNSNFWLRSTHTNEKLQRPNDLGCRRGVFDCGEGETNGPADRFVDNVRKPSAGSVLHEVTSVVGFARVRNASEGDIRV